MFATQTLKRTQYTRIQIVGFVVTLLASLAFGADTWAQGVGAEAVAEPRHGLVATELEGVQFVGPFGAERETNPKMDTFTFEDGKFATGSCLEWGFTPAPYWIRRDADGLHFLAELESREHGTMRYEGVLEGGKLTVVGYWKKERWYWTTERTYRGKGLPRTAAQ